MSACCNKLCGNLTKEKPEECIECFNASFCSPICLLIHIQICHNNGNEKEVVQYNIRKAMNIEVPNNNNPNDYFYFKNFQMVKVGGSRKVLGKGAFAEVCLVKHRKDNKLYAMKIIEKKKLQSMNIIRDEINIHFNLEHDNIIKLLSCTETTEFYYLIMEYAQRGSLYNEIRKNKGLKEQKSKEYFIQVIKAISYLHSLGLAHRDIKPENLLLDSNRKIKVCDFGGAAKIEEGKERNTFFGTYEYMAPEVIEGSNYNCSVDIWALGILLYECLHGYSPFRVS